GRILYINKAGRRLVGIPEEEDLRDWRLTPESLAILRKVTAQGVWHGRRTGFLEPYRGEGNGITAMQTVVAHRGGDGEVEFYSTIAIDITEQQRLEEERARLITIIEDAPDFIATADARGRILYVN